MSRVQKVARVFKGVPEECQVRVSHKSVKEECHHKSVQNACQVRASYKSIKEACQVRVQCPTKVSSKSVKEACQVRMPYKCVK